MNTLAENQFGHNGTRSSRTLKKIKRLVRPRLGKASVPFDWTQVIDNSQGIKIKNQGHSFSCGGQAGSYFLQLITGLELSAKSVYAPIAYPDGGTTVGALETQIGTRGANLENLVPSYDIYGNPLTEDMITDKSWITPAMLQDAAKRAGYMPISVHIEIDSMAWAIQNYKGIIIEIEGQNNGTWLSPYPKPPSKGNLNTIWAHFMCGEGLKSVNGVPQIDVFQSWGKGVGDGGIQHITQEYIDSGYIVDCFTFVPAEKVTSGQGISSMWWGAIQWFRQQLSTVA